MKNIGVLKVIKLSLKTSQASTNATFSSNAFQIRNTVLVLTPGCNAFRRILKTTIIILSPTQFIAIHNLLPIPFTFVAYYTNSRRTFDLNEGPL